MIVEIDDDWADKIVETSLIDSYISISKSIKEKNKWHEDDIAAWEELLPALKIVGKWYVYDFDGAVKKASKKK